MVTMKDVADAVGVSIATVSYCLNAPQKVKPSTREKILETMRQMNYIPNDSARKLKKESSRELGVVLPDIDDLFRSEVLKGIVSAAENTQYYTNVAFSRDSKKVERDIIDRFIGKNIAGLIILTCQPEDSDYFRGSIVRNNIPTVFVERYPENLDANFLSFDNYHTCYTITRAFIERGYRRMLLMCGSQQLFSEVECVRGFNDALSEAEIAECGSVVETKMTKESAFYETMFRIVQNPPQAILCTSELQMKGLMEGFRLNDVRVPEQTCVVTLGSDCWNETNYLPNVLHTYRAAYALGQQCVETLINNIQNPSFFQKEVHLLKDNIVNAHLQLPEPPKDFLPHSSRKKTLRMLSPALWTIESLKAVSVDFERKHDVRIEFETTSFQELFETIKDNALHRNGTHDMYVFDVSWKDYFARMEAFADLSDFFERNPEVQSKLLRKNLNNACAGDYCTGFPIIGGAHMLFYRRDLFDDPMQRHSFESLTNSPLQVPRTWEEFNRIARFFTKEYNPYSPTQYGVSVIGSIPEEMTLEIMARLWSYGGSLVDASGNITLNTLQNQLGYQSLLESCKYSNKNIFDNSVNDSLTVFGNGEAAMLISFTEYASMINNSIRSDIISRIDCAPLPGGTPANIGWFIGVNKQTQNFGLITELFSWLCRKGISYYMTVLNGQSTVSYPHKNHELLKLYPWLGLVDRSQQFARNRFYPIEGKKGLIPPRDIEKVLYDLFRSMYNREQTVSAGLAYGQHVLTEMFS